MQNAVSGFVNCCLAGKGIRLVNETERSEANRCNWHSALGALYAICLGPELAAMHTDGQYSSDATIQYNMMSEMQA